MIGAMCSLNVIGDLADAMDKNVNGTARKNALKLRMNCLWHESNAAKSFVIENKAGFAITQDFRIVFPGGSG